MAPYLVGHTLPDALWRSPDRVHQIGALHKSANTFKNIPVSCISEAIEKAREHSNAEIDAYFACAEFFTPKNRTAANASGAYAFWLDLDTGEMKYADGKGYATIDGARKALNQFCNDAGLPPPTHIVYSGGGIHVYWVLDELVERETWQTHAGKLKGLTRVCGLLADDSRTADIASILRIPGTLNFKYSPPRPVTLVYASEQFIDKAVMLDAIALAHGQLCNASAKLRSNCSTRTTITNAFKPVNGQLHLLQGVLRHIDADLSYDDWLHSGMALHHETEGSDDGLALFDAWSSTGNKYKGPWETAAKWRSFRSDLEHTYTIATLFWLAEMAGVSQQAILAEIEPFEVCGGDDE